VFRSWARVVAKRFILPDPSAASISTCPVSACSRARTRFGFKPKSGYDRDESRAETAKSVTKSVFTNKYKVFREALIKAREAAGITQRELSKKLSRPQSFVSKYERGERRLDVVEFLEVTKVLGIDPSDIVERLDRE
jgi:ribosome-binding protein aMBF1 (putative translation factor)